MIIILSTLTIINEVTLLTINLVTIINYREIRLKKKRKIKDNIMNKNGHVLKVCFTQKMLSRIAIGKKGDFNKISINRQLFRL